MKRTTIDLWVGVFVTAGVVALLALALKVGNATTVSASNGYSVYAEFDNIGGLKVRAPVKSAGVVVGRVDGIVLDQQKYLAKVTVRLDTTLLPGSSRLRKERNWASWPEAVQQSAVPPSRAAIRASSTETVGLVRRV